MPNLPATPTAESVLLVQLTDSHLFAGADGRLLGLETSSSLQRVIDRVREEQPDIDLLLASGDLSQDGSVASYQRFRELTAQIDAPARWCPGNHDELGAMREVTQGTALMNPVLDLGGWRVILLDSLVPGSVHGMLRGDQLELLDRALQEAPERHHLVSLHHHPVPIGSDWMDAIGLHNADALFEVLDRHAQVRALLWGHIHQEFDQWRNGVRLLATPSTGVQFMPGSEDFKLDTRAPGYRWLRLHADGRLDTAVSRVSGFEYELDSSEGY